MDAHIDLGQLITVVIIAIVGWVVNRTLNQFDKRLAAHDRVLVRILTRMARIDGRAEEESELEIT